MAGSDTESLNNAFFYFSVLAFFGIILNTFASYLLIKLSIARRSNKELIATSICLLLSFNLERHLIDRETYKTRRSAALAEWQSLMA